MYIIITLNLSKSYLLDCDRGHITAEYLVCISITVVQVVIEDLTQ